jgi:hypothetical protein
MRDVVLDLRSIGVVGTEVKAQAKGLLYKAAWVVAGVAIIAAAAVSFVHFREKPPARPLARLQLATPGPAAAHYLALSPDGRMLAFVAGNGGADQLWVRALDSLEARALAGTSGAAFPFRSPDSTSLGFFAERKLKKIAVSGGPAQALCEVGDRVAARGIGTASFSSPPAPPVQSCACPPPEASLLPLRRSRRAIRQQDTASPYICRTAFISFITPTQGRPTPTVFMLRHSPEGNRYGYCRTDRTPSSRLQPLPAGQASCCFAATAPSWRSLSIPAPLSQRVKWFPWRKT